MKCHTTLIFVPHIPNGLVTGRVKNRTVPIVNGWFRKKSSGLVYVLTVQRGVESEPPLEAEHTSVSCIMCVRPAQRTPGMMDACELDCRKERKLWKHWRVQMEMKLFLTTLQQI